MKSFHHRWKKLTAEIREPGQAGDRAGDECSSVLTNAVLRRWAAAREEPWEDLVGWWGMRLAAAMGLLLLAVGAGAFFSSNGMDLSPPPLEQLTSADPWSP